ncbi:response regulator [Paenibacillus qinlingensis]|uniref:Two-component system response regulator YesN n=1 Tax=Paenibacillus qinlingensis TaxID=1837343 RepID=A0ABU1NUJ6_9BACL|nr:response regulator [Paenibacillus qinlingensis]MDR6551148.1 two-component system response regulator YesN [Paenibacillus qinlingensis]
MIRIMVVEDEKAIRLGIVSMIEQMELHVSVMGSFANGLEAVQFLSKQAVDVIITDISMPRMDGFELAEHVRLTYPETSIIILSGYNQFDYVRHALRSGVSDYLVKPVNKKELHQVLQKLINQRLQERIRKGHTTDLLLKSYLAGELKIDQLEVLWESFSTFSGCAIPCVFVVCKAKQTIPLTISQTSPRDTIIPEMMACTLTPNLHLYIVFGVGDIEALAQKIGGDETVIRGISSVISRFEDWPRGYSEAISAYCLQWHNGDKLRIIPYLEANYHRSEITMMVSQIDSLLQNSSKWMDRQELNKLKDQLFLRARRIQIHWSDLCRVLGYLLYQMRMRISDATNRSLHPQPDANELELQLCEHTVLQDVFHDIFDRMDRMLGEMELEPGSYERKVVSTVKKKIEQTYNREIELSELASQVYLTANYVSFLFRKETGMTITEYMIDLRVTKAKELLLNQLEMKTYEVGQAVGYPDAAYFNRLFKKVVGTTPRMYREQTQITQMPN